MCSWIKDKWELVVSGIVVLFIFVLGRKKQVATEKVAESILDSKEKEIEVIERTVGKERLAKALARKKYSESKLELIKGRASAQSELEKETIERKLELLELVKDNPEKIDQILMTEFNIAKIK